MKVEKGKKILMEYEIAVEGGAVLESSDSQGPLEYIHGSGRMLPGLEARIDGLTVGEQADGVIPPEEAFGSVELPSQSIARDEFPQDADIQVGMHFEAFNPDGDKVRIEVLAIDGDAVQVRFEHPLADKAIHFKVKILAVSEAEEPEALAGEVEVLAEEPEALAEEPEALAEEPEALAGEVEALAGEVEALAGEVEALEGEMEALEGEMEALGTTEDRSDEQTDTPTERPPEPPEKS